MNDSTLHFGQMLKDLDHEKFEEGMKLKMKGSAEAEKKGHSTFSFSHT